MDRHEREQAGAPAAAYEQLLVVQLLEVAVDGLAVVVAAARADAHRQEVRAHVPVGGPVVVPVVVPDVVPVVVPVVAPVVVPAPVFGAVGSPDPLDEESPGLVSAVPVVPLPDVEGSPVELAVPVAVPAPVELAAPFVPVPSVPVGVVVPVVGVVPAVAVPPESVVSPGAAAVGTMLSPPEIEVVPADGDALALVVAPACLAADGCPGAVDAAGAFAGAAEDWL